MNKINIYWIEDNPIQGEFDLDTEVGNKEYFGLNLFQHPKEIKEYLAIINHLNESGQTNVIAEKCPEALPDIVVFDYKLSEDITTTNPDAFQYSTPRHYDFLIRHSISIKLKVAFPEKLGNQELFIERRDIKDGNYNADEFLKEVNTKKITDDEFGLYCGIAFVREFKNYIAIGIPATINKSDPDTKSVNSLFYEWLNNYDIEGTINRPSDEGKPKDWEAILKFSLPCLRERIKAQVQTGKITLDLLELLHLNNTNKDKSPEFDSLTITSEFGKRQLPLAGLFYDKTDRQLVKSEINSELLRRGIEDVTEKKNEVFSFVIDLLRMILIKSKYQPQYEIIDRARGYALTLWSAYRSERFWHRMNFSKLHKANESEETKKNEIAIRSEHSRLYNEYLKRLDNKYFQIQENKTRIGGKKSLLIQDCIEISSLIDKSEAKLTGEDKSILSWTALFVFIRVFKARMEFIKKEPETSLALPTKKEMLTFLFPIASAPIVLPIHNGDDSNMKSFLKHLFFNFENLVNGKERLDDGTKFILRCYANSIGLNNEKYFPEWIK